MTVGHSTRPLAEFLALLEAHSVAPGIRGLLRRAWRCHRSLIADALVVHGFRVEEILGATRRQAHALTPFAQVSGLGITYPSDSPGPAGAGSPHLEA